MLRVSQYLEYAERFSVSDSLRGSAVDGKDPVALLDPSIAISESSRNYFVHLKEFGFE